MTMEPKENSIASNYKEYLKKGYLEAFLGMNSGKRWRSRDLHTIAEKAECHNTGWPIGVTLTRQDHAPYSVEDGIEAVIPSRFDKTFDYWSLKNNGLPQKSVFSLEVDITNPNVLYAGTNGSGVFKTTNGGNQWSSANSGMSSGTEIHALAIHPNNSNTIFAGTKSGEIYKSTNGGNSWSQINISGHSSYIFDFAFELGKLSHPYLELIFDSVVVGIGSPKKSNKSSV